MRFHYTAVVLAGLLATAQAADDIMPPPGLYRVERDNNFGPRRFPVGEHAQRSEERRATVCIPAQDGTAPVLPPTVPGASCQPVPGTITGDSLVLVAQCPLGRISNTIQRSDSTHWQITTEAAWGTPGKQPTKRGSGVSRWTRIADQCDSR
ncbi:hypothetical protein GTP58_14165 [Duganella sp. CY15W]|uniref:hypothetical protein n=1 Tax=Duganella sp. CY15W TaxID=2692172 RepID=UPI001368E96B|nr:hypothetical protein [Duganella sp. CY15W]MYM29472.1 hypothetical protein [Duganella sp. CY15W]